MELVTRTEAIKLGLKYYFTGKFCPKQHLAKRKVRTCTCYECDSNARNKANDKRKSNKNKV